MREKKYEEIANFCKEHNVNFINIRNVQQGWKCRIKVSAFCKECGTRYDVTGDTLRRQKFPGLCTKCAHTHSSEYKKVDAQYIVDKFEGAGYKVLTPLSKMKPTGKNKSITKVKIDVQDSYGVIYNICWNNFQRDIKYYMALNEGGVSGVDNKVPSVLEKQVVDFLGEIGISYKREFKFSDCRGDKRMLPFDFCVNYDKERKLLIEVDGERHYKEFFEKVRQYDRIKDYYCKSKNIPLLRLPYWTFKDGSYKNLIISFINTNSSSDTVGI